MFHTYEISQCWDDGNNVNRTADVPVPAGAKVSVFWTLYGFSPETLTVGIADCADKADAVALYQNITGRKVAREHAESLADLRYLPGPRLPVNEDTNPETDTLDGETVAMLGWLMVRRGFDPERSADHAVMPVRAASEFMAKYPLTEENFDEWCELWRERVEEFAPFFLRSIEE